LEKEQVVKDTIVEQTLIEKLEVTKEQTPIERLEVTKEKTKEVQKNETKQVSDVKVARLKVKHDPVVFLLAGVLFVFIVWAPFILVAGFSSGAMILGGCLVMYQLADARRWSKSDFRSRKHMPGIFSLLLLPSHLVRSWVMRDILSGILYIVQ